LEAKSAISGSSAIDDIRHGLDSWSTEFKTNDRRAPNWRPTSTRWF
jgi:hypothetical protein